MNLFYQTTMKCNKDGTVNYNPIEQWNVDTYEEIEELVLGDTKWKKEATEKIVNRLFSRNKKCCFITHEDGTVEVFIKADFYDCVLDVVKDLRALAFYLRIQRLLYRDKEIGSL